MSYKTLLTTLIILSTPLSLLAGSEFQGTPLDRYLNQKTEAEQLWVKTDLKRILSEAEFNEDFIEFKIQNLDKKNHQAKIQCTDNKIKVLINASAAEWSSTLYKSLQKMGFLFPHPRRQISPNKKQALSTCNKTITWQPRFPVRGFHLHNQHPTEWIHGLYLGQVDKMYDTIRWLKRNQQNLMQIQKIKVDEEKFSNHLKKVLDEAKRAKIISSVSISFSLYQQKSYALLPRWSALTGFYDEHYIRKGIRDLQNKYNFQILTFEKGTSEFTSASYEKTLEWIEIARDELEKKDQMIFNKIHASMGQSKEPYGNFNYLPQYSHPMVGVLPHTVMAYALESKLAPVYGRHDFADMKDFLVSQSRKRPTIYYPETSYYISMDIDIPLFVTDYLVTRSQDMDFIEKYPTWGQVNFTTGHDMGYWLMDWTVALLADKEFAGQPMIGLKLLGEDTRVWKKILNFQSKYFKEKQIIQKISFANLQDEMNYFRTRHLFTHYRTLIRDYFKDPKSKILKNEIGLLQEAIDQAPKLDGIQSRELKIMMLATYERLNHALHLRQHLTDNNPENGPSFMQLATASRQRAKALMNEYKDNFLIYKDSMVDGCPDNPTGYKCGYAWTAMSLYHWEREEEMVRRKIYNPFYKNFYSVLRILL